MSLRITLMAAIALACAVPTVYAGPTGKRGERAIKEPKLVQVVYSVADLIVPIENFGEPRDNSVASSQTLEDRLMELIGGTVQPASWLAKGGRGSLQFYPLGLALVVNQTAEVHGEITDLLAALRRLQDIEVCVELRMVSMREEAAAEFRSAAGFAPKIGQNAGPVFITDADVLRSLEIAQKDAGTNIMQAPRITMANGQRANVSVSDLASYVTDYKVVRDKDQVDVVPQVEKVELGMRCVLLPTVSADRRFVQTVVDFRNAVLAGPVPVMPVQIKMARDDGEDKEFQGFVQQPQVVTLAFKQTCNIPDGGTMAVSLGKIMAEGRNESAPPILSKIPYVARLFRNVGYSREARELFLFVTPRIVVNAEVEQVFNGNRP